MKLYLAVMGLIAGLAVTPQAHAQGASVFGDALAAQKSGDYAAATALVGTADPVTRDLVTWMALRAKEGSFADITAFLAARPGWPGLATIRAHAESKLSGLSPADIVAFFDGETPQSGAGAVAYATSLIAAGQAEDAHAMLVDVWLNDALTTEGHQAIVNAFPDVVAPHHVARADMLLWRERTTDASNLLALMDEGQAALMRARIAIITRAADVERREALVPDRLRGDAGLHYDRFTWYADRGDWTEATAILAARSTRAEDLGVAWRWGSWRRILARWHMREGNIDLAYRLAADHFISPTEDNYDDLEWLAGYIALTYRRDFTLALSHFERFDAVVTSPISKGRAGYWIGRAHEGLGNAEAAVAAFQAGAQHQTSFYGLLSAEKLGLALDPDLVGGEDFGDWRARPALQSDLMRAGLLLLSAGERGLAVLFFRDAAQTMTRQDIGAMAAMFMEMNEPFYAVLIAKTAVQGGLLVQDAYFPLHPLGQMDLPVDPALSLAIARQESEFRVDAGSSVGALGIMQLMPATAEEVARNLGLPYSRARLTSDWQYNATLGSAYLASLARQFGDSPVMIAAGYNAGPSRPTLWMTQRGDPRVSFGNPDPVDVIDWIEHIPFRETRNYVMRVTEGIPIYRARLTGDAGPVRFTDLLIGAAPVVRPVARPAPAADAVQDALRAATSPALSGPAQSGPAAPSGPQSIRPVARAGDR